MSEQKNTDFASRRVEDGIKVVNTIFGMARQDFMALLLTVSIIGNIVQGYYLFSVIIDLTSKITAEVRLQNKNEVIPELDRRQDVKLERKVKPIREGVENAAGKVDTILNIITR